MVEVRDRVVIAGDPERVYQCFWDAELWPRITPHVRSVEMLEASPDRQRFRMSVDSGDKTHTVETERSGERPWRITYRQSRPPAFLLEHRGEWRFESVGDGVAVTLVHRATLDPETVCQALGVATVAEAERRIAEALRRNGNTTAQAVKHLVEAEAA